MELQLNKSVLPCLNTLIREVRTQEQTQEVRIADGMPDIGMIIGSWGQVIIRGKEWHGSNMSVSGGVMTWVMFEPEDGSAAQCIEAWLPFQLKWDFSGGERDGNILVVPQLYSVDARVLSARKIMIRASVGALGVAMLPGEIDLYEPGELPEDVCLQRIKYPIRLPREAGEKTFLLEETISLPASAPQLDSIVCYNLRPEITDRKIVSDKVVMRGVAVLHLLYTGEDGQLHTWDFDIPFSQYAELDREYEPDCDLKIDFIVTNLEAENKDDGLILKASLSGQYVIYDQSVVEIVSDAYSPRRQISSERVKLQLPALLDYVEETMDIQQDIEMDCVGLVDAVMYTEHPVVYQEEKEILAELSGTFRVLYNDENGKLRNQNIRWASEWRIAASEHVRMDIGIQPAGKVQVTSESGSVTTKSDLRITALTMNCQGMPMVTSMDMSEAGEPDPGRPSLILCRVGEDSLWEIAKRSGSTVELIEKANSLTQEPEEGKMLIVPVL